MANCGSGLPAEWPFRSQNAIEASDSPLPGGLWVKRLITHALCSLAYSDKAWCKLFLIFTMKCFYWVFVAYKTQYSVLIDNSIHIQEIDTEIIWLTLQGQIFRCIKHLSVSQLKYLYIVSVKYFDKGSHWGPGKFVTFHWRLLKIHVLLYQSDSYPEFPWAPVY